jgi:hypothetical protein
MAEELTSENNDAVAKESRLRRQWHCSRLTIAIALKWICFAFFVWLCSIDYIFEDMTTRRALHAHRFLAVPMMLASLMLDSSKDSLVHCANLVLLYVLYYGGHRVY